MALEALILTAKRDQVPGGLCLLHLWVSSCCEGRTVITLGIPKYLREKFPPLALEEF